MIAASDAISAGVTAAAAVGDVAAGKKVFRKCKACHKLEDGKNAVGGASA